MGFEGLGGLCLVDERERVRSGKVVSGFRPREVRRLRVAVGAEDFDRSDNGLKNHDV